MKKGVSLFAAAILAAGFVAVCGIGTKAEAQVGVTNVGLRLGYNVNETMVIEPYRWRGQVYYDTLSYFSNYGFHIGTYADVTLAEIDLGFEIWILGLAPALQLSWTGTKSSITRANDNDENLTVIEVDFGAMYLDAFLPVLFRWPFAGYSVSLELGAFGSFFLFGTEPAPTVKINDVLMQFDAGVMAGVSVEFGRAVNFGYRVTSGFVNENVFCHYVSLGFNIWRHR
jgi:hypothetical protein